MTDDLLEQHFSQLGTRSTTRTGLPSDVEPDGPAGALRWSR